MKNQVRSDVGPFAIVPLWLIESGVSHGAIACFALMWAKWADRQGECFPSRARIAAELGKSVRTTDGYLAELQLVGALTSQHRRDPAGDLTSNLYTLSAIQRGSAADCTTPCSELHEGGAVHDTGVVQQTAQEPYPEEPDPLNTSSSALSEPTDTSSADVIMSEDYDKIESTDEGTSTDQGSGLSHPSPTIPEELSQARTILIEEGHDVVDVEKALLGTEGGEVVPARWTVHRGASYPAEVLAESVRLAVTFADGCDAAGNKRPNPYTDKECRPMRMLLTNDEKPAKHIRLLIRWTFDDDFWNTNVLCSRKFRERWDQLAGARRRDMGKAEKQAARDAGATGEDWMARKSYG